jgi:hypothetical protein
VGTESVGGIEWGGEGEDEDRAGSEVLGISAGQGEEYWKKILTF